MSRRIGWDWSKGGLPPLEEAPQGVQTSPRRMVRFQSDKEPPPPPPQQPSKLPTLQRRSSLLAYDPIIVRFVKNGDKFFEGVKVNITQKTMRSWDTLLAELSRRIDLPAGVRHVYTPDRGHRVKSLTQLEHLKTYVCGSSEPFKRMDYEKVKNPDWKTTKIVRTSDAGASSVFNFTNFPLSPFNPNASLSASLSASSQTQTASMTENGLDLSARQRRRSQRQRLSRLTSISEPPLNATFPTPHRVHRVELFPTPSKPLALTIIRNAPPPREQTILYINKNSLQSWEEVKLLISENLKTVNGCLRLFSLEGEEVESLSQLWGAGSTLIAAGNEKFNRMEFLMGAGTEQVVGSASKDLQLNSLTGLQAPTHVITTPIGLNSPPTPEETNDNINPIEETINPMKPEETNNPVKSDETNNPIEIKPEETSNPIKPEEETAESLTKECENLKSEKECGSMERLELDYGSADKLEQESDALLESNSEPSIIAKEQVSGHNMQPSSEEPDTSPDTADRLSRGKSEVHFLSDSSGETTTSPPHQSLQDSPMSSAYPPFPPTPSSNIVTGRPRPRRLGSMFEDMIRPLSLSSSPVESSLLHAKHTPSPHKGFHAAPHLQPQTPQSDISMDVVPSLIDMLMLDRKEIFSETAASTVSNFSTVCSQAPKTRNIAIQTNYVDDHLSTIIEPEKVHNLERLQLNSREHELSQAEESVHDLECSAATSQFYRHIRDKYNIGMPIAEGNFAAIKLCIDKEQNKELLLRVTKKSRVFGKDDKILQEIEIMRALRHENVMTVQDYWENSDEVCMVMESIEGGDLFDAILYCQHFSEADAVDAMRQLCLALVYLHANQVVHRGVKPENIFLSLEVDGTWTLKLAGFSLATKMSEPLTLVCGNEYYRAPEMTTGRGYGTKVDVWSAGVIAYILLSGIMPFRRRKKSHTTSTSLGDKLSFPSSYWQDVSNDAKDFISHLLVTSPQERHSSSHAMQHPWLKKSFHSRSELSRKLIEYLNEKAAIKVAHVPILTVTALDHGNKKNNRNSKQNNQE